MGTPLSLSSSLLRSAARLASCVPLDRAVLTSGPAALPLSAEAPCPGCLASVVFLVFPVLVAACSALTCPSIGFGRPSDVGCPTPHAATPPSCLVGSISL